MRYRAIALMILGMLTACARSPVRPETRSASSADEQRFASDSVLVLNFLPGGQVEQSWQPASVWSRELSRIKPVVAPNMGQVVFVARRPRDCDQEQIDCHRDCMKRRPPSEYGPKKSFSHVNHCNNKCLELYMDCLEQQGLFPARFQAVDDAADWMGQHPEAVAMGGIILIAGVSFVVLSGGTGFFVLAPLVLLP